MSKNTVAASFLSVLLVFAFVQYHSVANSDGLYLPALTAEESQAIDSDNDVSEGVRKKKGGNGFVRALGAPFRALGRVFGGGKKNKDEQARRSSNKDAEKFGGVKLSRIKDANTVAIPATSTTTQASTTESAASDFQAHFDRGRQLLLAGNANGALAELNAAAAINPKSAEVNRLLGVAYESKGMRDLALRSFEAAVDADNDNSQHLNNLGFLLYKNGDYERATKYLKRAAKIDQNNARIWNNLGLVYCERFKFDDAYKSFVQASGEFAARLTIAAQLQQRGMAKDAIKHLERAQALRPNSSDVLAKLVSLYEMTGRPTDAENARRAIVALKTFADANK